jgi:hypothetical protein
MKLSVLSTVATATFWLLAAATTVAVDVEMTSNKLIDSTKGAEQDEGRKLQGRVGKDVLVEGNTEAETIPKATNLVRNLPEEDEPNAAGMSTTHTGGSGDGEEESWNPFRRLLRGFGKSRELMQTIRLPPPPAYYPKGMAWTYSTHYDVYGDNDDAAWQRAQYKAKLRQRGNRPRKLRVRKLLLD